MRLTEQEWREVSDRVWQGAEEILGAIADARIRGETEERIAASACGGLTALARDVDEMIARGVAGDGKA